MTVPTSTPTHLDSAPLIVITRDEAEQIIEASKTTGTAAEVISALSMLLYRAARYVSGSDAA